MILSMIQFYLILRSYPNCIKMLYYIVHVICNDILVKNANLGAMLFALILLDVFTRVAEQGGGAIASPLFFCLFKKSTEQLTIHSLWLVAKWHSCLIQLNNSVFNIYIIYAYNNSQLDYSSLQSWIHDVSIQIFLIKFICFLWEQRTAALPH